MAGLGGDHLHLDLNLPLAALGEGRLRHLRAGVMMLRCVGSRCGFSSSELAQAALTKSAWSNCSST